MTKSRILVTGFEPFAGMASNPSQDILPWIEGCSGPQVEFSSLTLPVVYGADWKKLAAAIVKIDPHWIVLVGVAGRRSSITIERLAVNLIDSRVADNAGQQPMDTPIVAGGPTAYLCQAGVKGLHQAMATQDLPVALSMSAGTFVCNHIFYAALHAESGAEAPRAARTFFVHIPPLDVLDMSAEELGRKLAKSLEQFCQNPQNTDKSIGQGGWD